MLNNKILKEFSEDIVKKGVRIKVDFPSMTPAEFGEKLLIIINYKSSLNTIYNIVDVRTYEGTNTIGITTYNAAAVSHLLKQLVNDTEQITISEQLSIIDLSDLDIDAQLEKLGLIKEHEEIVIIGGNYN